CARDFSSWKGRAFW
nr:immunoglobulin heavy chain junction region [Macaca mulatta]MOV86702.1 immunoglobulin heavy chain junction region [Macaca mulatta]MOV86787.1 immunoglobulin heavy chain junction region [Macaca mulatta]MOV86826.1 immunoglobulin heavy chain junction region [Macaca mulatta]MOV87210.1 immunoglobulin heavy chain junction region [Macaca mulatta]